MYRRKGAQDDNLDTVVERRGKYPIIIPTRKQKNEK